MNIDQSRDPSDPGAGKTGPNKFEAQYSSLGEGFDEAPDAPPVPDPAPTVGNDVDTPESDAGPSFPLDFEFHPGTAGAAQVTAAEAPYFDQSPSTPGARAEAEPREREESTRTPDGADDVISMVDSRPVSGMSKLKTFVTNAVTNAVTNVFNREKLKEYGPTIVAIGAVGATFVGLMLSIGGTFRSKNISLPALDPNDAPARAPQIAPDSSSTVTDDVRRAIGAKKPDDKGRPNLSLADEPAKLDPAAKKDVREELREIASLLPRVGSDDVRELLNFTSSQSQVLLQKGATGDMPTLPKLELELRAERKRLQQFGSNLSALRDEHPDDASVAQMVKEYQDVFKFSPWEDKAYSEFFAVANNLSNYQLPLATDVMSRGQVAQVHAAIKQGNELAEAYGNMISRAKDLRERLAR